MGWTVVRTPIGGLRLTATAGQIIGIDFGATEVRADHDRLPVEPVLQAAAAQLTSYFAGELTEFDLPLSEPRGSAFERAVWRQIAAIPYGQTTTYGQIARALGQPGAARAVGTACNRNPVPVVVPCHRVIGANGALVGFGGGLERKRLLLTLEVRIQIERGGYPTG